MRKLIAICALLLSASAAQAQTDKNAAVTKLPGEEKLSVRERAERDFLMPTRHKKMAEVAKATAQIDPEDATASPELDATAHYTEAVEARPDEAAVATRAEHRTALRHYSRSRSARHHSAARHTTKASAHRSTKKVAAHKTKTKTKKATATKSHRATKKTVVKSSHKKRRR
ncbi:MAG TPA: hypothetical protein VFO93_17295 [Hymenobacter sp.]|uniref:hypothetical protein n=1 Tax=Hymenobacter sp. TaxID=1898978 RepID=UPI002D7F642B|nr:hypothetical protein [Hymenobacter sp.]HET9505302.1 hypothetical protein [Hymenobacter sp.]